MYAIHTNQAVSRQTLRRKTTLSSLLFGEDEADALKSKNIKQTELVAALREAISRTADHFHCLDPRHSHSNRNYYYYYTVITTLVALSLS